jgi:RNA polymerase sigma-70 factor, ECF subfamily
MTRVMACDPCATVVLERLSTSTPPPATIGVSVSPIEPRTDLVTQHLLATARGDRGAFSNLYACSSSRLLGVALRIVRDRARAEDVLQDAFITIWECAAVFSPDRSSAMTWMTTIVHNRSLDRVRSSRRQPLADEMEDGVSRLDREAAPGRCPAGAHEFAEDSRHVRTALQTLPGHYRQALMLAYGHGCSHSEVAASMGVPIGTAKSWVRRGLADLRCAFASTSLSGVAASILPVDRVL